MGIYGFKRPQRKTGKICSEFREEIIFATILVHRKLTQQKIMRFFLFTKKSAKQTDFAIYHQQKEFLAQKKPGTV